MIWFSAQAACTLHGLQNGHQIHWRCTQRVQGTHHAVQVGAGGTLCNDPPLCRKSIRLRGHYRLTATKRGIRLADVGRAVNRDGEIALSHGAAVQRHFAVHHHRSGTGVDNDFCILHITFTSIFWISASIRTWLLLPVDADLHGAGIQRGGALP